jgi:hypothetical protein
MGGYGMGAACAADEPPLGTALGRSIWTQVKFRKYQTVHSEHLVIKKKAHLATPAGPEDGQTKAHHEEGQLCKRNSRQLQGSQSANAHH